MTSGATSDGLRERARAGLRSAPERVGARAHFRVLGVDPDRLDGPIVGVASTWTGTMPCNLNQRELAEHAGAAIDAAGGVALPFNTIAVSDNQSQGTAGMRASLISREVIADSIELMTHAHDFDALVCLVGCDKTVPAALMALARLDKPAVVLYSGPMRAGRHRGREVTIQDAWEAIGAFERGGMSRDELDELEREVCPGPGTCAGQFTANTMAIALECLGLAIVGDGLIPADAMEDKAQAAARAGTLAARLASEGPAARALLDRRALENAMAGIAATGGSTNGLLHLLAIAREAGVALELDELTAVAARTPVIASLAPGGRYVAEDLHRAGGTPMVIGELVRAGLLDGAAPAVQGGTLPGRRDRRAVARRRGRRRRLAAVQAQRLAVLAPREPGARGQRGQARGDGAPPPDRARARLRVRGGVRDGGPRRRRRGGRRARHPPTRGRRAARACARCSA